MKGVLYFLFTISTNLVAASSGELTWNDRNSSDFRRLIYVEDEHGVPRIVDLKNGTITREAELSDVTYYLYTMQHQLLPYIILNGDATDLQLSPFNPLKRSIFISHGWNNDYNSPVNSLLKTAILEKNDINLFVVDWNGPANSNYLTAQNAVPSVGKFEAEFIQAIQQLYGLSGDDFTLIGHSLGAHVAGCAGAALNNQVKTIIGLDPAGPLFTIENIENRLDYTDAQFIQAIHTNGALLGWGIPMGHVDFFPNGGSWQPGCGIDIAGTCAHGRAYEYLAESISRDDDAFIGIYCDDYENFEEGSCNNNKRSTMGTMEVDESAGGQFFFYTNDEAPYGLGLNGTSSSSSLFSSYLFFKHKHIFNISFFLYLVIIYIN